MAERYSTGNACPTTPIPDDISARRRLAENLKLLRMMHGWSQEALAASARIDRSYIGGIEHAKRNVSLDSLERLARAFGLSIPELLQAPDAQAIGERLLANIRKTMRPQRRG